MPCRPILLALALLVPVAAQPQSTPTLHQVRKIHIAAMGAGADATRFRTLLQDELRNLGFEISDSPTVADAILAGPFSYEAHGNYASAHATLQLKTPNGKRILWSGDYISQHKGSSQEDVIKSLAQTCAERLHKDWEKN